MTSAIRLFSSNYLAMLQTGNTRQIDKYIKEHIEYNFDNNRALNSDARPLPTGVEVSTQIELDNLMIKYENALKNNIALRSQLNRVDAQEELTETHPIARSSNILS